MYLEKGQQQKEQDIAKGLSFLQGKKKKHLQQEDHSTRLINLGHLKWEKIIPHISTALEGISAINVSRGIA